MNPVTIPAEIASNLAMHESALAHFNAMERFIIPLASMTERNHAQAGEALESALANHNGGSIEQIARAKVDARWLTKDTDRLLRMLREIIGQVQESILDLNGGTLPADEEALS
ncbi:hypothetical protein HFO91_30470 [Rhizobium leguminosarum]|uniref:hypothetical protein n=1 Tax=Rhizobium leguminosarum TaxID=384 RepID=UPI001C983C97|nr:hypothetical protein [Rhizobium leguminosarum]MBY5453905.1 hypothetical protein [Rhizobium leguminosarum]